MSASPPPTPEPEGSEVGGTVVDLSGLGATDVALAVGIVVVGIAASIAIRRLITKALRRGTSSEGHAEVLVGRLVQATVIVLSLVYALAALGVQFAPLLGALGIGGLAVALALQPTLHNLFSGLVLHAQRPVRVGEEVITGGVAGVVIDITSRAVVVQRRSGEMVHIPNSTVLDREIENLVRQGRRRTTLEVGVAYGTDVDRARDVLTGAIRDVEGVIADPPPRVLASGFGDSSIDFDIDYWHGPLDSDRRETRDRVVGAIDRALAGAGITIPFPQRTLWWGQSQPVTNDPTTHDV